jgi:hypothetical protein
MKTKKMSLATIQGKLSRAEMKNIMAGSGREGCGTSCAPTLCHNDSSSGNCYCDGTYTSCS